MSTDDALIRLEYKLDLIISYLQLGVSGMPMLSSEDIPQLRGIEFDSCPVCGKPIRIKANFATERVERVCGCTSPVRIVQGISKLTKPPEESHGRSTGKQEDAVPPDEAESGTGRS